MERKGTHFQLILKIEKTKNACINQNHHIIISNMIKCNDVKTLLDAF